MFSGCQQAATVVALVALSLCSYPFSIIFSQSAITASSICCLCFRKCKKPESKESVIDICQFQNIIWNDLMTSQKFRVSDMHA